MGATARIRHCPSFASAFRRGSSGRDGVALSGCSPVGTQGLGEIGVETVGEQTKNSLLHARHTEKDPASRGRVISGMLDRAFCLISMLCRREQAVWSILTMLRNRSAARHPKPYPDPEIEVSDEYGFGILSTQFATRNLQAAWRHQTQPRDKCSLSATCEPLKIAL